jgi:hypothetical protein
MAEAGTAGLVLWRALGQMLAHVSDLSLQNRQIPFHHGPDFPQVYAEIIMNQNMAHLMICGQGAC